jgi:enoyl-CoA hydratase/carnithine racemase
VSEMIKLEQQGSVWIVNLNRPDKRNALSVSMVEYLIEVLEQSEAAGVDMLVFRGEGLNFCAGFDFTDFEQISEGDLLWRFVRIEQLLARINSASALTVALAHGKNFGAGVDLLAVCKHRVASTDASFRMPGLKFGLVLGTRRLAQLIGAQKTREIQQVAQTIDAPSAKALGLLQDVVDPSQWSSVLDHQAAAAKSLSRTARQALYRAVSEVNEDADLAALVRSVTVPGLKQRIAQYRAGD